MSAFVATAKKNRRERELARARQEIVAAAARAFAKSGVHGTTMEGIAAEAGYGTSSLYTYFKSKDELIRALFDAVGAQFEESRAEPLLERLPFPARLELLLARQLAVVERNRDFFLMFYAHRGSFELCGDREIERASRERQRRWLDFMAKFFARGMTEGAVRRGDARELAQMAIGAMHAVIMRWVADGQPAASLEKKAAMACEFLLYGVGARKPSAPRNGARP
jgi:AcrR family transcriptional regulator